MPVLARLLAMFTREKPRGAAPEAPLDGADFLPLTLAMRAKAESRLGQPARPLAPALLVDTLGKGSRTFLGEFQRVLDEVERRCADAEVWQNFYLDLLDEDGDAPDEGEGMGAQPVAPDEELRRLLAGVLNWPQVRSRFAWELGYHSLRYALASSPHVVKEIAASAAEDFLLAYDAANDPEGKVNALGDMAGALTLAGDPETGRLLCDYAATVSEEEARKQELHRLRKEGASFVRESYGKDPE